MFTDISISSDLNSSFNDFLSKANASLGVGFSLFVLQVSVYFPVQYRINAWALNKVNSNKKWMLRCGGTLNSQGFAQVYQETSYSCFSKPLCYPGYQRNLRPTSANLPLPLPLLKPPPPGFIYFKHIWGGGGLILFRNDDGIISPWRTRIQSGKAQVQEGWRSSSRGSESNPNFQLVNKPSRIAPHDVLQSWLIKTVYHLLVNNN